MPKGRPSPQKRKNISTVAFLNPRTCGIYKSGGQRFKTDPKTGRRTAEIDNELMDFVTAYLDGKPSPGEADVPLNDVFRRGVLVPTYYDRRYMEPLQQLLKSLKVQGITIGNLMQKGIISVRGGHGSPGNDQRSGCIPYITVSDIRALRVNVNPTNLLPESVARRYWRGKESHLKAWDIMTPNRASSNIGEFAILLPGEERIVITKEVYILRVEDGAVYDPFYLLWALSLLPVRNEWRRVALMQTNREELRRPVQGNHNPQSAVKGMGAKSVAAVPRVFHGHCRGQDQVPYSNRHGWLSVCSKRVRLGPGN